MRAYGAVSSAEEGKRRSTYLERDDTRALVSCQWVSSNLSLVEAQRTIVCLVGEAVGMVWVKINVRPVVELD